VSDMESKIWVNTLFRGSQLAEFLAVKKHLGIQSNTDVVRHLIHKQARALRRRTRSRPPPPAPVLEPLVSAPPDLKGQEPAGQPAGRSPDPADVPSLCLSCSLPDCDEADPRCRYQQASGQRARKRAHMRAYSRRRRAASHSPAAPDDND
jgi:hypothetical protein